MIHEIKDGGCQCNDCHNGRLISRLSDRVAAMALRQIEIESALSAVISEYDKGDKIASAVAHARKVLGAK